MAKYIAIPTADGISLANAKMVDGTTLSGLTNNTAYSIYRLSDTAASAMPSAEISIPANIGAPMISGTPSIGQTLTASTGTWSGSPTGYAYQWLRAGVAIIGATGATYVVQTADAGATIAVTVTASNAGGSASATSSAVGPITASSVTDWWTANAYADLDYENDRAYVNGIAYATLADARTAGIIVQTGGIDRIALPTLTTSYAIAARGVTGSAAPSSSVPQYLVALDDGNDGKPADELIGLAWATSSSVTYANIVVYAGSASQVAAIPSAASSSAKALSGAIRMALRAKVNSAILSVDGTTLGTDTGFTNPAPTQIVVGNREDGTRGWTGTIGRIAFVNAEITEAELNALLA